MAKHKPRKQNPVKAKETVLAGKPEREQFTRADVLAIIEENRRLAGLVGALTRRIEAIEARPATVYYPLPQVTSADRPYWESPTCTTTGYLQVTGPVAEQLKAYVKP